MDNNKEIIKTMDNNENFVRLRSVNKIYPNNVQAVYDFTLDIKREEFVALVGPSGCGKSTTLRMIAGLEDITSGDLFIDGKYSNYTESKDRDIAMVFQSYALYPHLNVYDNISFGLKTLKMPKTEIEKRVFEAAKILDLGLYLDRRPKELSGGQMQRVALGRAIVRHARLFLMDEPLSNLDAKLRLQMRTEIVRIHEEIKATTIYVTHDQTEAMTMADRIVVMNKGFIQQVGAPMDIYDQPDNLFVATFIGAPAMNIVEGTYDKNKLIFADGSSINLPATFKKLHKNFYQTQIDKYQALLAQDIIDVALFENSFKSTQKTEVDDELIKYKRKEQHLSKFQTFFNKTLIVKDEKKEQSEIHAQITALIKYFTDALKNPHPIKFGIRPEDVYLADAISDAKMSETLKLHLDIVETLGSEYIAYAKWNNADVVIKLSAKHPVRSRSELDFKLNLDRIHLFDNVSGLNLRRQEK